MKYYTYLNSLIGELIIVEKDYCIVELTLVNKYIRNEKMVAQLIPLLQKLQNY